MGHVPQNDGTYDEFVQLIQNRNAKRYTTNSAHPATNRCMVASATQNRLQSRAKTTLMDSGAGLTVVDDDELYLPSSKRPFRGHVLWGDGSRKAIKYSGEAPAIGTMINTGGAASANLLGVGCTLDALTTNNKRNFVMAFDRDATYLMRDAKFHKLPNGEISFQHSSHPSAIMEAARRGPGQSGVYEVPLYDHQASVAAAAYAKTQESTQPTFPLSSIKAMSLLPFSDSEPQ